MRALIKLAKNSDQGVYSLAEIAREENISLPYLEQIFAKLKKAGLVEAKKGVNGGYFLVKPIVEITVRDIVEILENDIAVYKCLLKDSFCPENGNCQTQDIWMEVQANLLKSMEQMKLIDFIH